MFRIRRIHDDLLPVNRDAIHQVQQILRSQFPGLRDEEVEKIGEQLRNPFKQRFRSILYVAENGRRRVLGFALLMYDPVLHFGYLDYLAADKPWTGRGFGEALYRQVRSEARRAGAAALFFECLPDDPSKCPDAAVAKANARRLRFYERFGARPIVGTAYETPIGTSDGGMPHLVCDLLDGEQPLRRDFVRKVVRAILERKYGHLCPPQYVEMVVASICDDPVRLRPPKYVPAPRAALAVTLATHDRVPMVVNEKHDIHHVRERGYVQAPVRVSSILAALEPTGMFRQIPPRSFPDAWLRRVHDPQFIAYLRRACESVGPGRSLYPYVFPIRNATRPPKDLSVKAGYYCIDTFTPLNPNAFLAARRAADCTLTAAAAILQGERLAYALVRPPGHHAERRAFGGFCYFNNAALAAEYLAVSGRVAILDIDYHHGNGQQDIFYRRADVLTLSLHGHPNFAYPYFSGFEDERGEAEGEGANWNFPLPEKLDGPQYRKSLARALRIVAEFRPSVLVVALGLDTARADPTGTWSLAAADFTANGRMIGELQLPTLVVQEGGYRTKTLGLNARHFFEGLFQGAQL